MQISSQSASGSSSAPSTAQLDQEFDAAPKKLRPQSTIAQAFSDQLNDVFLINDDLDQLASTIEQKKQSVSYQSTELQLLEERIRRAEKELEEKQKRLSARSGTSPTSPLASSPLSASASASEQPNRAPPLPPPQIRRPERGERDYVVVEKTPSVMERRPSSNSMRSTGMEAPARAPPPPPPATGVPSGV